MIESYFGWTVRNFIPDFLMTVKMVEGIFRSQFFEFILHLLKGQLCRFRPSCFHLHKHPSNAACCLLMCLIPHQKDCLCFFWKLYYRLIF
jgi:hypothetical protein